MDGKDRAEEQKHRTALRRVRNLINKLLLNAMRYHRDYHDYTECQLKAFVRANSTPL